MNSIDSDAIYFHSLATRETGQSLSAALDDIVAACKSANFDVVIIETPGIGQGDADIVSHIDASLYVITPEYGAASQLEKINMLDFADLVTINKYERRGSEDARRDVARQMVRNQEAFGLPWEEMAVFGTSAAHFNDDGLTALYHALKSILFEKGLNHFNGSFPTLRRWWRQTFWSNCKHGLSLARHMRVTSRSTTFEIMKLELLYFEPLSPVHVSLEWRCLEMKSMAR